MPEDPVRVLIVDDYPDAADALALLLRVWGHDARAAYSSGDALDMAGTLKPHVMLVDLDLPGMDGCELAHQVRGLALAARPTLIAVTGYSGPGWQRRAAEAGFDHFLL